MIEMIYFLATFAFIMGLRAMSAPATAVQGMRIAGVAMVVAVGATFFTPGLHNLGWMVAAIAVGGGLAWIWARRVAMTEMPQMVAIYNGLGGGAAAAIAAVELLGAQTGLPTSVGVLAILGAVIGAVAFSGSLVAWAKLDGRVRKVWRLKRGHNDVVLLLAILTLGIGLTLGVSGAPSAGGLLLFFVLALALGALVTLPIGGADMPVVISLLNAFTGLAVGFEGYVLANPMLIVAGIVVGASGTLLTLLMAKAMNRPIRNVLFAPITGEAAEHEPGSVTGRLKTYAPTDAAAALRYAQQVVIVPGYGMAVAGAQHKVWEMAQLLEEAGVTVKFAIHPVAGRMPGHMNVLLAEAGVPYEKIFDLDEINGEFPQTDVVLVIGANDVVNPAARTNPSSPIYGMPILDVDRAREVIVIKRGQGRGYSGIENELFYRDHCHLVYGNAHEVVADIIAELKTMG
ncbi:NAD(P) transhydrogenase subunit beta [Hydrogenophilus thermoluteolus]|uniref:NAD(P) transhydrogenase subunit beta n=2 Tax=Hydrogenophilus thermoluteolus TaxID=297 RepID=A0A2Z6DX62_HYDTE|nr:NAD(P) transhydrogenase subunit beta [Hydrogenophilus thermoluteolus]